MAAQVPVLPVVDAETVASVMVIAPPFLAQQPCANTGGIAAGGGGHIAALDGDALKAAILLAQTIVRMGAADASGVGAAGRGDGAALDGDRTGVVPEVAADACGLVAACDVETACTVNGQ